jgi:hypothetical protein
MASLDKLEGEAIQGIGLVLLIALAAIAYFVWKGASGFKFPDIAGMISNYIKALINALKNNSGGGALDYTMPSSGELDGGGADWVATGTNIGAEDLAASGGN